MNALKVANLCKSYANFELKNVGFSVQEGRIVGLIGRNGAGKSTTLKSILNLVKAEGDIEYFGTPLIGNERQIKQKIGYVNGGFDFYPLKTLKSIASVTADFYEEWDNERFNEYLKIFELDAKRKVKELSNGMKVKFSIALALSHGARVLILDEPTSGLDPLSREEFCDIILKLAQQGISTLFSTHITSDLMRIADDVVFISNGEVFIECTLKDLLSRYCIALFDNEESISKFRDKLIGVKKVKEGFKALVAREDSMNLTAVIQDADLDDIFVLLELNKELK